MMYTSGPITPVFDPVIGATPAQLAQQTPQAYLVENDQSTLVGYGSITNPQGHAWVWAPAATPWTPEPYTPEVPSLPTSTIPTSVYTAPTVQHTPTVGLPDPKCDRPTPTHTPEPGTMVLCGVTLLFCGLMSKVRKGIK